MKRCITGTGYVGLVTGTCLADFGLSVTCVDQDETKISLLNSGGVPIYKPNLAPLIEKNISAGRFTFTTDLQVPPSLRVTEGSAAILFSRHNFFFNEYFNEEITGVVEQAGSSRGGKKHRRT